MRGGRRQRQTGGRRQTADGREGRDACSCLLRSASCGLPPVFSKSLPEPNLKTVVVAVRAQIAERALFILRYERQTIRYAIFDREYLIRIGGQVRRIRHRHVLADTARHSQSRGWRRPVAGNYRTDFQAAQPEEFVARA